MVRRTNRTFNLGLVVAAAVVVLVLVAIVGAVRLAAGDIERGRTEGTARFGQLAQARILAQQARTDETLQLITRGDIAASEKSFYGHVDDFLTRLGPNSPAATEAVQKWVASHRKQVDAYKAGDYPAAVSQALGTDPGASGAQFAVVESSLRDAIEQSRATMRDHVSDAGRYLAWTPTGDAGADGAGRGGRSGRVVAAAQGVPVNTRVVTLSGRSRVDRGRDVARHRRRRRRFRCRPAPVRPAGAQEITAAPQAAKADCGDREASLRPGSQPSPGAMPPGSTMAAIQERGRLDRRRRPEHLSFGFRDPGSGRLEGFDIDLAREIARAIFGDPDRIELQVVDARQRESALSQARST